MPETNSLHNKLAPYWAAALFSFMLIGISTTWINLGWFWSGYVLDIMGPAWTYILIRGLFTGKATNAWTRFFSPAKTYIILLTVANLIELMQYFEVYESTFDLFDMLAYSSLLSICFIVDFISYIKQKKADI